jgi:hypothetical protein
MNSATNGSQFINSWGAKPGGKANIHDRLGGRVNEESNDRLEEMVDSLVPDEDIMCRASKCRRTLQLKMKDRAKHTGSPILSGIQMAGLNLEKGESSAYSS